MWTTNSFSVKVEVHQVSSALSPLVCIMLIDDPLTGVALHGNELVDCCRMYACLLGLLAAKQREVGISILFVWHPNIIEQSLTDRLNYSTTERWSMQIDRCWKRDGPLQHSSKVALLYNKHKLQTICWIKQINSWHQIWKSNQAQFGAQFIITTWMW